MLQGKTKNYAVSSTLKVTTSHAGSRITMDGRSLETSGESRIIFLPERSSTYQYRPEISPIIVKKQSRTRLLFAHPLLCILKTQKMYCAF